MFLGGVPDGVLVVVAGLAQHGVGDVVLAGAVGLHDGGHHVLRHVLVVGQQLLGVLGQAVAAVAEGGVVVVAADAGVQTYALDDGARVETFHFCVSIKFIEVAHAEGEVGVGEELHGLGLLHAHEEGVYIGLERAFLEEGGEGAGGILEHLHIGDRLDGAVLISKVGMRHDLGVAHDDAAGIEVVVECLAFAEELGREEQVQFLHAALGVLQVEAAGVAHGDGGLNDHDGIGIDLQHQVDDFLDMAGVKIVLYGVVVGRGGDDHEVGIGISPAAVEGGGEQQRLLGQVALDIVILDG